MKSSSGSVEHPGEIPVCHLPFAVQVVSRQRQLDEITGNCLTQSCVYREGVYDSIEREFRGFGHLQQSDSERSAGDDEAGFTAPVRVCTWFLTGQAMDRSRHGYFDGDRDAVDLRPTVFSRYHPGDEYDEPVTPEDEGVRHAIARALVGAVARIETWTGTDEPANTRLCAVEEFRYRVRDVQPTGRQGSAAVLLVQTLEKLSYQYDGFIDDPLCRHEVLLASSEYGHATHSLTISYARRRLPGDPPPFSDPDEQQWWRDAHDPAQSFYINETRARAIDLDDKLYQWRLACPGSNAAMRWRCPKVICRRASIRNSDMGVTQRACPLARVECPAVLSGQTVQRYIETEDGSLLPDGSAQFEALKAPLEMASFDKTALAAYDVVPPPFDILQELANIGYTPMALLFEDSAVNGRRKPLVRALQLREVRRGQGFLPGPCVSRNPEPRLDRGAIRRVSPAGHQRRTAGWLHHPLRIRSPCPAARAHHRCQREHSGSALCTFRPTFCDQFPWHRKRCRCRFSTARRIRPPSRSRPGRRDCQPASDRTKSGQHLAQGFVQLDGTVADTGQHNAATA
jgi:hypothetical protein